MKKIISIFLALAMILSLNATAFADDNTILTIASVNREYNAYQLLTLTTSLKAGDSCSDGKHDDDCYNYAYTVNGKYREVFQEEVFAKAADDNEIWGGTKPANASKVTDAQILEYLGDQDSDDAGVYKSMRDVADRLYLKIKEKGIDADVTGLTDGNVSIDQGYWMFADVTDLNDENMANSLIIVDTKGQDELVISPKTALPAVEKKVKDINDSEDDNITDNEWQDSADHDMGDVVPFKLTGTLPSNVKYYDSFKMIFHDTLSAGLAFDKDSVKVYMYNTKADADADKELDDFVKNVTENFTVTDAGLTDGCTFEVNCDNVLGIGGVTGNTVFVVYYEAELDGENVVIGSVGNPNEVYLEFSNNPYGTGTGKTEKDKVVVFTYKVIINKTDAEGKALKGAGFELYKKNSNDEYVLIGKELKGDEMTTFVWEGLDDGDYKLVESTVPDGYNKMSDIKFTITAQHDTNSDDPILKSLDGGNLSTGAVSTGEIEEDVVNNTGVVLPETGGKGTIMLIGISSALVAIAAIFMITRKKMSIYED